MRTYLFFIYITRKLCLFFLGFFNFGNFVLGTFVVIFFGNQTFEISKFVNFRSQIVIFPKNHNFGLNAKCCSSVRPYKGQKNPNPVINTYCFWMLWTK